MFWVIISSPQNSVNSFDVRWFSWFEWIMRLPKLISDYEFFFDSVSFTISADSYQI